MIISHDRCFDGIAGASEVPLLSCVLFEHAIHAVARTWPPMGERFLRPWQSVNESEPDTNGLQQPGGNEEDI